MYVSLAVPVCQEGPINRRAKSQQWVLIHYGHADVEPAPFARRLMGVAETKLNRHLYDARVDGYGMVLFPRK